MFFIAFIIADIPENINDIHNKIFIIHQNFQGLKTVKNPNNINKIAIHNNNRDGRFFILKFHPNKIHEICIIILLRKSNIPFLAFYLQFIQKFLQ